jgi:hypothetical protein
VPRKGLPQVVTVAAFDRHTSRAAEKLLAAVKNAAAARRVPFRDALDLRD